MIHIQVLIDNFPSVEQPELKSEHGLSFFVMYKGKRILCDMGASPAFLENAEQMQVNLKKLDFAFLSHGHADHTGGLRAFLSYNDKTPVYLASSICQQRYFSSRRGFKREISTEAALFELYPDRLIPVSESTWLGEGIAVVRNQCHQYAKPLGNQYLTVAEAGTEQLDAFTHELSLAFVTSEGLVILSSCSHEGALNIIDSCVKFMGEKHVRAFIGGLHLVDSDQVADEASLLTSQLQSFYPGLKVITGHCTGVRAREVLKEVPFISFFQTGWNWNQE